MTIVKQNSKHKQPLSLFAWAASRQHHEPAPLVKGWRVDANLNVDRVEVRS
jgi:hypothetical protein